MTYLRYSPSLRYFEPLDSALRELGYVESTEFSMSDDRIGHICLFVDTKERLTLSMIAEIFGLVQKFVGDQYHPSIELGPKTIALIDLLPRIEWEAHEPIVTVTPID